MRKLIGSLVVLAVLAFAGTQAFAAASRGVKVGDNFFIRHGHHTISVGRGTTLRFRWEGRHSHDVHAVRGPARFQSAVMRNGTFARTLSRSGTYVIRCDLHPRTMRLTVHVG
jgi:plastocyanin